MSAKDIKDERACIKYRIITIIITKLTWTQKFRSDDSEATFGILERLSEYSQTNFHSDLGSKGLWASAWLYSKSWMTINLDCTPIENLENNW